MNASFQQTVEKLNAKLDELKEIKKLQKDLEDDVPMDLEDLLLSLKDLKKQVSDKKDEHIKNLMQNNADYNEYRERVRDLKEEAANLKLQLFTDASNLSREHGDIDQTIVVNGAPFRIQTQKEVQVYLDGKLIK